MSYGDALMVMFDKALDRMCDIYITIDENHNMFSLNIQPHVETLTIDNDEEPDESLMY